MYGPLRFYTQEFMKSISDRGKEVLSFLYPAITMYEDAGEIVIEADLPGFDKKEVKVRLENNAVIISASRKIEPSGTILFNQRPDSVYKRIRLPYEVDSALEVAAKYQNGILTVRIPAKGFTTVKVE
ncbi:MAG: archaeal heat shock protein Hsp14 [Thermoplasmataceae archaeon]